MLITQYILNIDKKSYSYVGSGTIVISGSATSRQVYKGIYNSQFQVGEYVYDQNHIIWQILSISGPVDNPVYYAQSGSQYRYFNGSQIFNLSQENKVMDAYASATIENYQNVLDRINEIDPPSDVVNYENITIPFSVGEFVFTSDNTIWKIITIQSSVNSVSYTIENSNQIAVVQENQIFKMNQENQVIDSIYNNNINYYASMLSQINNKINNF